MEYKDDFSAALKAAQWAAQYYKKTIWVIRTKDGYQVRREPNNMDRIPGTGELEIHPENQ